ncbi:uncharacterized protein LOC130995374 [Salvia miltiorrhiza]|uniref:uncharacterized protein LOC130995374 n=1 Tax=Salvia miltiorrhiza TaxID=226208 RepID=UPI0025AB9CFA|nr:uncharacterized protein LOC130995374 [Salvia miltiorrhiza]
MASAWFPVVVIVLALAISGSTAADTVYDILRYYGFPPGLIPTGVVRRYELNPNTGQFALYLNTTCSFTAFNYDVQFRTQITGVIQNEEIMNLRGVQVRIMSYWATMVSVEMVEEDEEIEFSVGYTAVDMPAFYFYDVPQCGCGFDCP